MMEDIISGLSKYSTSLISDCLGREGVLCADIHPLSIACGFCGPAFTVEEKIGKSTTIHLAVSTATTGQVLMVNAGGSKERAAWGAILNLTAITRNLAAIVVDGMVRDIEELLESPLPIFGRGVTAAGPLKGQLGTVGEPIYCGGIMVRSGDIVRGDRNGVVVVPLEKLSNILAQCAALEVLESEEKAFVLEHKMTNLAKGLIGD